MQEAIKNRVMAGLDPVTKQMANSLAANGKAIIPVMLYFNATLPFGANLYAYCSNNPVMYTDSSGTGKLGVVAGTSLLNSWNKKLNLNKAVFELGVALAISVVAQVGGQLLNKLTSSSSGLIQSVSAKSNFIKNIWADSSRRVGIILASSAIAKWFMV